MTDLITEAREIASDMLGADYERAETRVIAIIPKLCDALEKADKKNDELMRELSELARESVKRDVTLARLEAEVEQAIAATRWIDAEYDTPDIGQKALLYLPHKEADQIRSGEYVGEGDYRIGHRLYRGMEIDAWMPLPEPPKGE